ncbi:MAG: hypothetical protein ACRC9Q_06175, partial [Bacteroidales bacterium]
MRKLVSLMMISVLSLGQVVAQKATITVKGSKNEKGAFKSESGFGFERISPNEKGEFVLTVDDLSLGYGYIYVSKDQRFNHVYLTPGAAVVINETAQ